MSPPIEKTPKENLGNENTSDLFFYEAISATSTKSEGSPSYIRYKCIRGTGVMKPMRTAAYRALQRMRGRDVKIVELSDDDEPVQKADPVEEVVVIGVSNGNGGAKGSSSYTKYKCVEGTMVIVHDAGGLDLGKTTPLADDTTNPYLEEVKDLSLKQQSEGPSSGTKRVRSSYPIDEDQIDPGLSEVSP